ncbi:MAG: DDE-type integrase/transposase/recombinase, partial [Deltaproteobacteria bacterium]|nr:DDE-type integrase/transposase/recombinase [Deltaproteobacteria bacterium]
MPAMGIQSTVLLGFNIFAFLLARFFENRIAFCLHIQRDFLISEGSFGTIKSANQVLMTDITYIRMRKGFLYLVAIMDWLSWYLLSWSLSNTLDASFCLEALDRELRIGQPEIFNSDQGVQFTSQAFTGKLEAQRIRISMDGRGRVFDNIFVERLWRTVKYEEVYLKDYESVKEATMGLRAYFRFYNEQRPHQA